MIRTYFARLRAFPPFLVLLKAPEVSSARSPPVFLSPLYFSSFEMCTNEMRGGTLTGEKGLGAVRLYQQFITVHTFVKLCQGDIN